MSVFTSLLEKPGVQRFFWNVLRAVSPVIVFRKTVLISGYPEVVQALTRDTDFTIAEINQARMDGLDLAFFLGMDRSAQHDRELRMMQQVVKREDLALIQTLVRQKAAECLEKARSNGRIDVVNDYARVVPVSLIRHYFGLDAFEDRQMMGWMRALFHHLFLNLTNDEAIAAKATTAAGELSAYLTAYIARYRQTGTYALPESDTVLDRLLKLQDQEPWITNDVIRRNISGFIIGSVDTTSKCCALAMDVLLDKKAYTADAVQTALRNDTKTIGRYLLEALRFNPHNPIVLRYNQSATTISSGARTYAIPAGATLYIGIAPAMWDTRVFQQPDTINLSRTAEYLHFSYGLHACSGRYINMAQIPELMAGLLRLPNIRKATGDEGKMVFDGPFPDRFMLNFTA
ncbi:cytochrome P450 [Arsenicibacter rosenii]|uniref:Cytochrome n=1 Tax=Arsenicibacter rosenii TaxID=1750698 RepID=A0A1S2VJB4_9BACT|nr:cytochrome P450 [Arsenicibacter rosenii]OIN58813.1 hypothetical protein BLX24_11300 [Arsenicibacter rosenii]